MNNRKASQPQLPELEFSIFSSVLSLLNKIDSPDQLNYKNIWEDLTSQLKLYKARFNNVVSTDDDIKQQIEKLIVKFQRKNDRNYGNEAFDMGVIAQALDTEDKQKAYLSREKTFQYHHARQLINIVSKILNHFRLNELSALFSENYFDQVDLITVYRFLNPEYKNADPTSSESGYPSLLTIMYQKNQEGQFGVDNNLFKIEDRHRLIPKNKLNPRLKLSLTDLNKKTPQEKKYGMSIKDELVDTAEIKATDTVLTLKHNKHASITPGPLCLSSFPIAESTNPSTEVISDLITKYQIASVVTIEEKVIAEYIDDDEKKALPSDWLQHGVAVGLVECPDLHALEFSHNYLVAQYLFTEVLSLLPRIDDDMNYIKKVGELLEKGIRESDIPQQSITAKVKNIFPKMFNQITDSHSNHDEEMHYFHHVQDGLGWNDQSINPAQDNQKHVLIHCKAGMSRSATALLSMYIMFVDVMMNWHANSFIRDDKDKAFFGAILKAIFQPSHDPEQDARRIINIFIDNYRPISPLAKQVTTLMQLIQCKRNMLLEEAKKLDEIADSKAVAHHTFLPKISGL